MGLPVSRPGIGLKEPNPEKEYVATRRSCAIVFPSTGTVVRYKFGIGIQEIQRLTGKNIVELSRSENHLQDPVS